MKDPILNDTLNKEAADYAQDKRDEAFEKLAADIKRELRNGLYSHGLVDWRPADICDEINLDVDQEDLRQALGTIWLHTRTINSKPIEHLGWRLEDALQTVADHLDKAAESLCRQLAENELAEADKP